MHSSKTLLTVLCRPLVLCRAMSTRRSAEVLQCAMLTGTQYKNSHQNA